MQLTYQRLFAVGEGTPPFSVGRYFHHVIAYVRRVVCALRGHDMVRHFEPDRLSLQCLQCGAETVGWRLDVRRAFRVRRVA